MFGTQKMSTLVLLGGMLCSSGLHGAGEGSRTLADGGMVAELMEPNSPARYNTGVRFTPVAAVVKASYDGREFLMHKERPNPLTDAAGLFYEFDLVTPPPGFEEAAIGEPFVKIGVGALVKSKANYAFFAQHKIFKLADTQATWGKDSADFVQTLAPVNGYGYELKAKVSLKGRTLDVAWTLRNTGSKPFTTHHYCHNSFSFDNAGMKPGSAAVFPFDFQAKGLDVKQNQRQEGREIIFPQSPGAPANIAVDYPAGYACPNRVSYVDASSGLRLDAETSVPGERVAVHVSIPYLCLEQFVATSLKPGESASWTRSYTLYPLK